MLPQGGQGQFLTAPSSHSLSPSLENTHSLLSFAALGAINAMQDAVILANCLYEMGEPTVENIRTAFQTYYDHRFPWAKKHVETSDLLMKLMSGQVNNSRILT